MKHAALTDSLYVLAAATVVAILVTLGGTLLWMTQELDKRVGEDSVRMMAGAVSDLLEKTTVVATDYSIWNEAYDRMQAQDEAWIVDNFASDATMGEAFQLLVLAGGPFETPRLWTTRGGGEADPALVPQPILAAMHRGSAEIPVGTFEAEEFFARIDGQIFALSGSRVSPHDEQRLEQVDPQTFPMAVFGSRIDQAILSMLSARYLLDDVRLVSEPGTGAAALPLPGHDGEPVAYISWTAPKPAAALFRGMLPSLVVVLLAFLFIVAILAFSARENGRRLSLEQQRAAALARTDTLTGLPNRLALVERLEQLEQTGRSLGVLFMDLNGLKTVNDAVGHSGGDELIRQLAVRLQRLDPVPDFLAAIGGDEFVLTVEGSETATRATAMGEAIRLSMLEDFQVEDRSFQTSAAVGIALPEGNVSPRELFRRADLAMHHGKRQGTSEPILYDGAIESDAARRKIVETALREALTRPEEFAVHYQPIVDADTGLMVKAECLARWNSTELGPIPPELFISVAEETGMIGALGQLIFARICRDLQLWPELCVSVNISPSQLGDGGFVQKTLQHLRKAQIEPARIDIELTERVIVANTEMAAFKLDRLAEAGFSTSLDDFGTGYSSIGYLKRMPFNTLKIDKSFVAPLPQDERALKMVEGILMVGKSLGQTIVCEGIETEAQARALSAIGCDQLQGNLFAMPMPFEELAKHPLAVPHQNRTAV